MAHPLHRSRPRLRAVWGRQINKGVGVNAPLEDPIQRREVIVVRADELRRADRSAPAPDRVAMAANKPTEAAVRPTVVDAELIELAHTKAGVCEGHDTIESHKMLSHLRSGARFATMCQPLVRDEGRDLLGLSGINGAGYGAVVPFVAARHCGMDDAPNRIREWRKARGMSGAEMARRLNTTRQTVSRLEKGPRSNGGIALTDDWMHRIAAVLNVDARDLVREPMQQPAAQLEQQSDNVNEDVQRRAYRRLAGELDRLYRAANWPQPAEEIAVMAFEAWSAIQPRVRSTADLELEIQRELEVRRRVLRDVSRHTAVAQRQVS